MIGRILGGVLGLFGALFGGIARGMFGWVGRFIPVILLVVGVLWIASDPAIIGNLLKGRMGGGTQINSSGVVVTKIQSISTLASTRYESEVDVDVSNEPVFDFLPRERMIIRARGVILAGVELQRITEQDVTINGTEVAIRIPPAHIISQEVQYAQLRTDQGILPGVDPALQSKAQDRARQELLNEACNSGVLARAEQDAQKALSQLLSTLDFETVRIIQNPPNPAENTGCP